MGAFISRSAGGIAAAVVLGGFVACGGSVSLETGDSGTADVAPVDAEASDAGGVDAMAADTGRADATTGDAASDAASDAKDAEASPGDASMPPPTRARMQPQKSMPAPAPADARRHVPRGPVAWAAAASPLRPATGARSSTTSLTPATARPSPASHPWWVRGPGWCPTQERRSIRRRRRTAPFS